MFTYVPRAFVEKLIKTHLPELDSLFSYILCKEEMVDVGEFRVKDVSPLLLSRKAENIIIVDTRGDRIDDEIFSSIIVSEYNGSVNYSNQMVLLKQTLKSIKEQPSLSSLAEPVSSNPSLQV
jgi:hypothetical protein